MSLDESVSVKITFWKVVAAINARETHTCVEYGHLLLSERDKGAGGGGWGGRDVEFETLRFPGNKDSAWTLYTGP